VLGARVDIAWGSRGDTLRNLDTGVKMGREIRRVPPNWEHPKKYGSADVYQPMHAQNFDDAVADYKQRFLEWENSGKGKEENCEFWEYEGNPPGRDYYVPYRKSEATWYQAYETVSEGTPVSPPFATQEELITYLAEHGDFWSDGWGEERARAFVDSGYSMSMMIVKTKQGDSALLDSKDIPLYLKKCKENEKTD